MISSLQRITGALLGIALLAFTIATAYQVTTLCSSGQTNCVMASVIFGVPQGEAPDVFDITTPQTTVATVESDVRPIGFVFDVIQMLSVYIILLSVVAILILEVFELRYLKRLTNIRLT